jgi:hypothetical protein
MKQSRPTPAKILQHGNGLGVPNAEMVRKRARELAEIDGAANATEEHWRQAKRELHGGHSFDDGSADDEMQILVSEHDFVATESGHHTARVVVDDDEHVVEELIAEGMDEALHEQMLEASRELREVEDEDKEEE